MQKLLIVRGHSGSGKTTFAKGKINEFNAEYPNAKIYHFENDMFLVNAQGHYHWTVDRLKKAMAIAKKRLEQTFKFCQQNPQHNVLIVVSNVQSRPDEILALLTQAQKQGIQTEVYRMQNWFENQHANTSETIIRMFLNVHNNPIENEILVEPIMPMPDNIKQQLYDHYQFE